MEDPVMRFNLASVMMMLAVFNWLFTDLSLLRRKLAVHDGRAWVAARWFGVGLFTATACIGAERGNAAAWIALVGSAIVLFASAKRIVTSRAMRAGG